ncbi:unnamed protein product [Closterium sp. NIES-64]|nr:unnamed protein product [Closterium sp. NIES-64]
MDARASRSPAPRWPFFRRLRALLLVVARLSFHLPVATINAIRDRNYRPRTAIQAASPAAAGMRDAEGRKMVNEYVRERVIGRGSYAKVLPSRLLAFAPRLLLLIPYSFPLSLTPHPPLLSPTPHPPAAHACHCPKVLYRHAPTGLMCALKVCCKSRLARVRVAPGETALMDVQREIRVLQRLQHPHVVHLREVIDDPSSDKLYLVVEYQGPSSQRMHHSPHSHPPIPTALPLPPPPVFAYLDGRQARFPRGIHHSLVFEYLDGGPVFPEDEPPVGGVGEERARRVFRDVSAALLYVHGQGVVHNDVKPANILCTAHGAAKLADFGVCQEVTSPDDLQRRSPGTPAFTAPECCTGEPFKGMAADTWALGCTLYAMVCGRHPFLGPSLMDTYDKRVIEVPSHLMLGCTPFAMVCGVTGSASPTARVAPNTCGPAPLPVPACSQPTTTLDYWALLLRGGHICPDLKPIMPAAASRAGGSYHSLMGDPESRTLASLSLEILYLFYLGPSSPTTLLPSSFFSLPPSSPPSLFSPLPLSPPCFFFPLPLLPPPSSPPSLVSSLPPSLHPRLPSLPIFPPPPFPPSLSPPLAPCQIPTPSPALSIPQLPLPTLSLLRMQTQLQGNRTCHCAFSFPLSSEISPSPSTSLSPSL